MMKHNRMRRWVATLSLLLGMAHIAYGALAYKALTLESFWFFSFGLAMILTALSNFSSQSGRMLVIQNTLMVIFTAILAYLALQPQIILGLILFCLLLVMSKLEKTN